MDRSLLNPNRQIPHRFFPDVFQEAALWTVFGMILAVDPGLNRRAYGSRAVNGH